MRDVVEATGLSIELSSRISPLLTNGPRMLHRDGTVGVLLARMAGKSSRYSSNGARAVSPKLTADSTYTKAIFESSCGSSRVKA